MSLRLFTLILLLVGAVLASTSRATEAVPEMTDDDPSCACVAQGKRWAQGDETCLAGLRMVCGMERNVTTWKSLGKSCQVSFVKQQLNPLTAM